jgi:hypothetical protein
MVVDYLRDSPKGCYTTWMQFGDDPPQASKIRWYWAAPGAKDLGIPTPFMSRNWDQWTIWPDLGEVQFASRVLHDGNFPIVVPGQGPPCGAREVWEDGYRGPIPAIFPRNMFGLAACCGGLIAPLGQPTFGLQVQVPFSVGPITSLAQQWSIDRYDQQEAAALASTLARKAAYPVEHVGKILEVSDISDVNPEDKLIFGKGQEWDADTQSPLTTSR